MVISVVVEKWFAIAFHCVLWFYNWFNTVNSVEDVKENFWNCNGYLDACSSYDLTETWILQFGKIHMCT